MTREEQKLERLRKDAEFVGSIKNKYLNQEMKNAFRETVIWKTFRGRFYSFRSKIFKNGKEKKIINTDYFTGNKLSKKFNLHHLDLDSRNYTDLNENKFIPLNPKSHECLHWFYTQSIKDEDFEKRFLEIIHKKAPCNCSYCYCTRRYIFRQYEEAPEVIPGQDLFRCGEQSIEILLLSAKEVSEPEEDEGFDLHFHFR